MFTPQKPSLKRKKRLERDRRAILAVEALEQRWVPASAMQDGDTLSITFDDPGETVTIRQDDGDAYTVFESNGTTAVVGTFSGVNNIIVDGDGIDGITLNLDGNDNVNDSLAGDLTINQPGGDTFTIQDDSTNVAPGTGFGITGAFTVNNSTSDTLTIDFDQSLFGHEWGTTTVNDDDADANVNFVSLRFTDFVSLMLGDGDSTTTLINSQVDSFFSVIGGSGDDSVGVDASTTGNNLGVDLGTGTNSFVLEGVEVANNLFAYSSSGIGADGETPVPEFGLTGGLSTFQLTNGIIMGFLSVINNSDDALNADVTATEGTTQIDSFASVIARGGDDSVTFSATTIGDNLGVNLGTGTNSLELTDVTAENNIFAYGANAVGADGETPVPNLSLTDGLSTFGLTNSTVTGFVSIINNSALALTATVDGSELQEFLSFIASSGEDAVSVLTTTVDSAVAYALGVGNDTVDHGDSTFNGLVSMTTGEGEDNVTLDTDLGPNTNSSYMEGVFIEMGADDDTLTFGADPDNLAELFADADVDGGAGTNVLDEDNVSLQNGASINAVNFA